MKVQILLVISLFLMSGSCGNQQTHPVPYVPFNLTIDLNLPGYFSFAGVGGWAYVNGGSRGIIVYRRSIDEFIVFDRHSVDVNATCPSLYFLTPTISSFSRTPVTMPRFPYIWAAQLVDPIWFGTIRYII